MAAPEDIRGAMCGVVGVILVGERYLRSSECLFLVGSPEHK